MQVEIWSDIVCPWCYLGKRQFENALGSFEHRDDVDVVYRSFELDPTAPTGITTPTVELLATKYGMTTEQAADAQRQMQQRAALQGLDFQLDGLHSGNTRDAHRLLHLARAAGRQADLAERLHRAYFSEQLSVFDPSSLAELAVDAGLDPADVRRVLDGDEYDDAVTADESMAAELGVTGVPFFVIERRYAISGAQPEAAITQTLDAAWAAASVSESSS
jgi:predicted DsbA family dithiol-disulfide isomerase